MISGLLYAYTPLPPLLHQVATDYRGKNQEAGWEQLKFVWTKNSCEANKTAHPMQEHQIHMTYLMACEDAQVTALARGRGVGGRGGGGGCNGAGWGAGA